MKSHLINEGEKVKIASFSSYDMSLQSKQEQFNKALNQTNLSSETFVKGVKELQDILSIQRDVLANKLKLEDKKNLLSNQNKLVLMLKKRNTKKQVYILTVGDKVVVQVKEIISCLQKQYLDLTKNCTSVFPVDNFFAGMLKRKLYGNMVKSVNSPLHQHNQLFLNTPFSKEELLNVLNTMKKFIMPGPDGLPSYLYKAAKDELVESLTAWANKLLQEEENNEEILDVNSSLLIFIPKSSKCDFNYTFNDLRPISVINTDVKIIIKVLYERIQKFFPVVFPPQVVGFRGCGVANAAWIIYSVFNHRDDQANHNPMVFRLDFQKAFDMVNIKYLSNLLIKYFGDNASTGLIIKLLKYKKITVMVQGLCGSSFSSPNGILQGSPLASAMFSLYILEFVITIKKFITGVKVIGVNERYRVTSYCDDVTIFCDHFGDIDNVIKIIQAFEKMSGAVINKKKSYILNLKKHEVIKYKGYEGEEEKILGILFGKNNAFKRKIQIDQIIENFGVSLKKVHFWYTNVISRAVAIDTVLIAKLIYLSSFNLITNRQIKNIESIFSNYLWKKKRMRISYYKMTFPITKGGLGIKNIRVLIDNSSIRSLMKYVLSLSSTNPMYIVELWSLKDNFIKSIKCKYKTLYGELNDVHVLKRYKQIYSEVLEKDLFFQSYSKKSMSLKYIKKLFLSSPLIDFGVKCMMNILPTKVNLTRRHLNRADDDICNLCEKDKEDACHIFGNCVYYRFIIISVLFQSGFAINTLCDQNFDIMKILCDLKIEYRKWVLIIMYAIWCHRCKYTFEHCLMDIQVLIVEKIKKEFLMDYQIKDLEWIKRHWPIKSLMYIKELQILSNYVIKSK